MVAAEAERVGTGQVGMSVRYRLSYAERAPAGAPASVVAKLPSPDDVSRATGVQLRNYEREVAFYRGVAATVDIRTPHCYHADWDADSGDFVLVLEDLAPAVQGDQIAGCSVVEARIVLDELAKLHAPRWADPASTTSSGSAAARRATAPTSKPCTRCCGRRSWPATSAT